MWHTVRPMNGMTKINWQMFETKEDLLTAYWRRPYSMQLALVFHNDDPINSQLSYEIRTNPSFFVAPLTTELFSSPVSCRETESFFSSMISTDMIDLGDTCPVNQYYYSGFIALQALLDFTKIYVSHDSKTFLRKPFELFSSSSSLRKLSSGITSFRLPSIQFEMFPKDAHTGNWLVAFRLVIPIYLVMALSQFITYLLILIVVSTFKLFVELF